MWNEADRRHVYGNARSYTPAVDIWSHGVTVCECVYGLPKSKATGVDWCQEIIKGLQETTITPILASHKGSRSEPPLDILSLQGFPSIMT